jgi:broad specificity phosphatase PhoE
MQRGGYLARLITAGCGWCHVLQIYLSVGSRFWRWRMQLWLQRFRMVENTESSMKQTLLIVRHGQTTWNVEHRLPGQLPGVALNDHGRQQAARLAEALTVLPISTIISSPLERAYDTAEFIAKGRDLTIQLEADLMDTDVGPWAGKHIEELAKNDPAWKAYVRDPTVAPEGIETFPQVQQRVVAAVERWRTKDDIGAYPVFVAHADVIKLILAHYSGLEVKRAGSLSIDNASVSLVELEKDLPPRVVAIGWSPHPGWLKPPALEGPKADSTQLQEQVIGEQKT